MAKNITKTQQKIVRDLCKHFNVRYRIQKNTHCNTAGECDTKNEIIVLRDSRQTIDAWISICLHEICHILAKREGKFRTYHSDSKYKTKNQIRTIIRTGWRAERYVDKRAKQIMTELYPGRKQVLSYEEWDKDWYNKNYLDYWREQL